MSQRKHRSPGSIGGCATPGRVFKGVRMAGRMGNARITVQNLTVQAVDAGAGLILIKGAVPGPKGALWCWSARPSRRKREGESPSDHRRRRVDGRRCASAAPSSCPSDIFDVQANIPLMHQVVVAPAGRGPAGGTHKAKTRGEVSGGGSKPYKQKGTGRARQGSIRAPQFTGGGVSHGPVPRDYSQRTPKKMKAAALRGALSDRARDGRMHVVESFVDGDAADQGGPRDAAARRPRPSKVLVVLSRDDELSWLSAAQPRRRCTCSTADQLNTYDVLVADDVVFTKRRPATTSCLGVPGPTTDGTRRTADMSHGSPTRAT